MRLISGISFIASAALMLIVLSACGAKGELRSLHAEEGSGRILGDQPSLVTFTELQAEPGALENTLIRVTGSFYRLPPPDCLVYSGPDINWSLVADNLRLDAQGFERKIQIVPDGIEMTVDGIFRMYEGPLGCGKRPERATSYYLEVVRIVEPNPLSRVTGGESDGVPSIIIPDGAIPTPIGTLPTGSTPVPTPELSTPSATVVPTMTPSPAVTGISTQIPTSTATSDPSIPTLMPSATRTSSSGIPTLTPSPTPSPLPGTPTATPTNITPPTAGPTVPPLTTSTPGGYPAPPTPEVSPTGYPGL